MLSLNPPGPLFPWQVTPERPVCLERYSDLRALGRVALRDGGRTVAVGVVTAVECA
jgi:elongation factor 1 alpha-like protein